MDLATFAAQHGGLALAIRRHFQSRKVRELDGFVDKTTAKVLRLARHLDDAQQGLSVEGEKNAFRQGQRLVEIGLIPGAIATGTDDRNLDGGLATAEGIFAASGPNVPVMRSPGITYPYYGDTRKARDLLGKYGDAAAARHLSGLFPETRGLWVESVAAFEARLMGAVDSIAQRGSEFGDEFELWDLNYEQMVLLRHRLIIGSPLSEIDLETLEPLHGAGIAIAKDGTIAEFTADLDVGSSVQS